MTRFQAQGLLKMLDVTPITTGMRALASRRRFLRDAEPTDSSEASEGTQDV